jgi:hypothetical protein
MSVRLDWEIEAEGERLLTGGEDPESRRRRWRARLRVLAFLLLLLFLIGALVGALILRLRQVDWEIEQALRDTVDAEVATLRIGDLQGFLAFQRSATQDWALRQEALFDEYQQLKVETDANLTGRAIAVAVDRQRGRVQVEEILGGVPYGRVWFYWRYDDGWRHVPPDYTFWGEARTIQTGSITVNYRVVDEAVAQAIAERMSNWIATGCAALLCATPPSLRVEIVANPNVEIGWSAADAGLLQVPSPYLTRARLDQPFESRMQYVTALLVAERLIASVSPETPLPPADAVFLRQSALRWLVERFASVRMDAHLAASLVAQYGETVIGRLLAALSPDSNVGVLSVVTGTPLHEAGLDWRDFVGWRLDVERELNAARNEAGVATLYDLSDAAVQAAASARYNAAESAPTGTVHAVRIETDANGTPILRAQLNAESGAETEVLFRLIDGVWKRAS